MIFLKQVEAVKCNLCLREINTDWESYIDEKNDYHECTECAFITEKIDETTYLKWTGKATSNTVHAGVKEGKVVVWHGGKKPPWERRKR